jgi:hypothetical protein
MCAAAVRRPEGTHPAATMTAMVPAMSTKGCAVSTAVMSPASVSTATMTAATPTASVYF